MSDIKLVNMSVPLPKKTRRSRKASIIGETVEVPTPTIVQSGGMTAPAKAPAPAPAPAPASAPSQVIKKAPVMVLSAPLKQNAGDLAPAPINRQTKRVASKPTLNVPIINSVNKPYNESPNTPSPVKVLDQPKPVKIVPAKKPVVLTKKAPEPLKVNIVPNKRPNKTLKKKYTAKKITIHMENSSKVRKTRDAVRRQVANMDLTEITSKLRVRGLIRDTANPPEQIQRSMMIDILLFPSPV